MVGCSNPTLTTGHDRRRLSRLCTLEARLRQSDHLFRGFFRAMSKLRGVSTDKLEITFSKLPVVTHDQKTSCRRLFPGDEYSPFFVCAGPTAPLRSGRLVPKIEANSALMTNRPRLSETLISPTRSAGDRLASPACGGLERNPASLAAAAIRSSTCSTAFSSGFDFHFSPYRVATGGARPPAPPILGR